MTGESPKGPPWGNFEEWAEAQFGPRPDAPSLQVVQDLEQEARAAREAYNAREAHDDRVHAALYAWNIADREKTRKEAKTRAR